MLLAAATYAITEPKASFDGFLAFLKSDGVALEDCFSVTPVLGRVLRPSDYAEGSGHWSRFLSTLDELCKSVPIRRTQLVRHLLPSQCLAVETKTDPRPRVAPKSRRSRNREKAALSGRPQEVFVTAVVNHIGAQVFARGQLTSHEDTSADDRSVVEFSDDPVQRHESNPESMSWGSPAGVDGYFSSVSVDGVDYKLGDWVIVYVDYDAKENQKYADERRYTTNEHGHKHWFARIQYFFEQHGQKVFHGQWLTHGSKTVLQELSHPNGLFYLKSCDTIPVASILQMCHVKLVDIEPSEDEMIGDHFFQWDLTYDENDGSFTQLSKDLIAKACSKCKPHKRCVVCGLRALDEDMAEPQSLPGGFAYEGITYHLHDFIYLFAADNEPLQLGQITSISPSDFGSYEIDVRFCKHHGRRDVQTFGSFTDPRHDERLIFFTCEEKENVEHSRLAGKFFVKHKDDVDDGWFDNLDHFVMSHQETESGAVGSLTRLRRRDLQLALLRQFGPLRGLELFAGVGGLSEGLRQSGIVDTRWAVEFSPSCAKTLKTNHPEVVVFNQDCNVLLKNAVDAHTAQVTGRKQPKPVRSLYGNSGLGPMPKKGEVDIIFGGPPCQGFSMMNHHKKKDDVRTTLPGTMLSYVEFYRPSFVLIENVRGMLHHKLLVQDSQSGMSETGKIIEMGMIKFIQRVLISLGLVIYQVHMKVLQAAQYGVPQTRPRVIFWAAQRGIPLPSFPVPTHYYKKRTQTFKLATGKDTRGVSRGVGCYLTEDMRREAEWRAQDAAPHPKVTIMDAISDLPKFHWQNPHREIKQPTSAQRREMKAIREAGIPIVDAVSDGLLGDRYVGFKSVTPYAAAPQTGYQYCIRQSVGKGKGVTLHYSSPYTARTIERVVNIPLRPRANWEDLPKGLPVRLVDSNGGKAKRAKPSTGVLTRLSSDDVFQTAMVTLHPSAKASYALHPTQHRVFTVREGARAQGLPDNWQLCSINIDPRKIIADQLRQIGNAVPVPLALALGRELGSAVSEWYKRRAEPRDQSPEV
ncbi:S-adenosyl-L-methionine-dependent methyltransferase [Vararia minispora EC-137]|uniref:S-adenosyl-L-methionine-dependent methyltransferase n=1 Tax=Vararia minispora EC-137 TaxID=1314806 RepID=A0ACB8QK06_9AGAM|nr:S-adenosyl-L-methionine-dependent methyltransferase [Vararia minispora EC-137]